jgi:hypothetical protein
MEIAGSWVMTVVTRKTSAVVPGGGAFGSRMNG